MNFRTNLLEQRNRELSMNIYSQLNKYNLNFIFCSYLLYINFFFFLRKCLDTYDKALSLIDTDEMWDKYLTSLLELTSDTSKIESYKRDLLKCSMQNAHKRNKLKPIHYIEWVREEIFLSK